MDESTPPQPARHSNIVMFVIVGIAVIGFIAGALILLLPDDKKNGTAGQPNQFQNWLKPTNEIKIGNNRYVSACSALPVQTANETFGPLSGRTVIQENYADHSLTSDSSQPMQFRCGYNHGAASNGPDVALEAQQYPNAADTNLQFSLSFDEDKSQAEIDRYKKAIAETNNTNKDIAQLVADFQLSLDYYMEKTTTQPKNYILPISDSLSGALSDFNYAWQSGNGVYALSHTPNTKPRSAEYSDYSNQELIAELGKVSKAYTTIKTNIQNKQLDQSPAPTILGNTNKYGSTTVLESCAILNADVFNKITGKQQTEIVDRTTASIDFTTEYHTTKDNQLVLPANDCGRQNATLVTDTGSDDTYADLTMRYAKSEDQAKTWLNQNFKQDANDTTLTTNADWAVSFQNPLVATDPPIVVFRVGAYIGIVNMYTSPYEGEDINPTNDQYVAAINVLTTSLKQNIANIQ